VYTGVEGRGTYVGEMPDSDFTRCVEQRTVEAVGIHLLVDTLGGIGLGEETARRIHSDITGDAGVAFVLETERGPCTVAGAER
jgi:hypothetical protein